MVVLRILYKICTKQGFARGYCCWTNSPMQNILTWCMIEKLKHSFNDKELKLDQNGKVEVINLSSILVGELKDILENVPEDYEVIMEIRTGCDTKAGTSIAYINGVKRDDEFKEIRLMNQKIEGKE